MCPQEEVWNVPIRRVAAAVVGLCLMVVTAGAATAASPRSCPHAASGFTAYEVVGSVGDPAPAPGEDPLWDLLIATAAEEGLTLTDLLPLAGVDTLDELYAFVVAGWQGWDKNADDVVCVKLFPSHDQGTPAFVWNFIDNNANVG
ncbi:MAG TPA: hypothetical protein VLA82_02370 [Actinomycetota bacterium]|nr:hypothetical protein [Actinomycetota bacterium]